MTRRHALTRRIQLTGGTAIVFGGPRPYINISQGQRYVCSIDGKRQLRALRRMCDDALRILEELRNPEEAG